MYYDKFILIFQIQILIIFYNLFKYLIQMNGFMSKEKKEKLKRLEKVEI